MSNKAPALENGLAIIELVAERNTIGFNQIKAELDINPASLTRYINALLDRGFIKKDTNKQYILGDKMFQLLTTIGVSSDISEAVQPILENISNKLGCTVQYMSYENGRIVCKAKYMHRAGLVMQNIGESRTDYIIHPWGYLYLASLDEKKRRVIIGNSNVNIEAKDMIPKDGFLTQLIGEASKGYSDDKGKIYKGIRRIATPVYKGNKLVGAIGIGLLETSLDYDKRDNIIRLLLDKSKELSEVI